MKLYYYLKLRRSGIIDTPMLVLGNRKDKRVLLNTRKTGDPTYWVSIYRQLGWVVRPEQIRLSHDLICVAFGLDPDCINPKFARKLHNYWRAGNFDPSNIRYDQTKRCLITKCPTYEKPKLSASLGVTPWQAHYLLRQSEPKNKIALGLKKAY